MVDAYVAIPTQDWAMVSRSKRTGAVTVGPAAVGEQGSTADLVWTVGLVAAIWVVSDVGYYYLFPALGLTPSYNAHPAWSALYYAAWIPVAVFAFRRQYRGWFPLVWSLWLVIVVPGLAAIFAAYALYAPGLLPAVKWTESWPAPDILVADRWYFLPKSIDILFQQLLIVALVLAMWRQQHDLRRISVSCGLLFGVAHLLLAFGGLPVMYVIRFTTFATLFGFVFPWLILKVRNGFAWSYSLHWTYYAATLITAHTISPYAQ